MKDGHIYPISLSAVIRKGTALGIIALLAAALTGPCSAAAGAWTADEDLFARSYGARELHLVLQQEVSVPHADKAMKKSVMSSVAALDARVLEVSFSSTQRMFDGGRTYTSGLQICNRLEFEESRDLVVFGYLNAEWDPLDPEHPNLDWGSKVHLLDIGTVDLVDTDDRPRDPSMFGSGLNISVDSFGMGDMDALFRSMRADMDRLKDEGMAGLYEIGYSTPQSDSAGGVTCFWGERETITFDI